MSREKKEAPFSMGGQAVLEGVMMNGKKHYALTVRRSDGELVSKVFDHNNAIIEKYKFLKWPIIRGCVNFVKSMSVGMKVLDFSAEVYAQDPEQTEELSPKQKAMDNFLSGLSMVLGVVLAVGLFIILPVMMSKWVFGRFIEAGWLLSLVEGVFRMFIFFAYLLLVSRIKDIARTFEYHGAEHKVVACYEAGEALTVENARKHSRLNKRCGTSFLFIIMIFSIVFFMFLPVSNPVLRIAYRLLLLPVIAGASYELLKFSARSQSPIIHALVAPGLLFQKITTKEPDDEELEVAINSAIMILEAEGLEVPQ